jgi:hypothetical protein
MSDGRATSNHAAMFPPHECGLYLNHNEHRDYYQSVEDWLGGLEHLQDDDVWGTPEAKQRAIDTDEVWRLQWYPNTPVGFNVVCAPTLDEVLELARTYAP